MFASKIWKARRGANDKGADIILKRLRAEGVIDTTIRDLGSLTAGRTNQLMHTLNGQNLHRISVQEILHQVSRVRAMSSEEGTSENTAINDNSTNGQETTILSPGSELTEQYFGEFEHTAFVSEVMQNSKYRKSRFKPNSEIQ